MKSNTQYISIDDWISAYSKTMALELIGLIDGQRKEKGDLVGKALTLQFLAAFTAASVVRSLGNQREGTSAEQFEAASKGFLEHKVSVQDAVAAGFSGAMREYSGKSVDYYCQIKVVPEVVSKSVN